MKQLRNDLRGRAARRIPPTPPRRARPVPRLTLTLPRCHPMAVTNSGKSRMTAYTTSREWQSCRRSAMIGGDADHRCPSRSVHERPGVEPRSDAPCRGNPRPRTNPGRQARSRQRDGVVRGHAPRRRGPVCRNPDRPLCRAGQSPAWLAFAGAGLGPDAGAAGVVPDDGRARRAGADYQS